MNEKELEQILDKIYDFAFVFRYEGEGAFTCLNDEFNDKLDSLYERTEIIKGQMEEKEYHLTIELIQSLRIDFMVCFSLYISSAVKMHQDIFDFEEIKEL